MEKKERVNWIKLIQEYDEDFKISDYTPDELDDIIQRFKTNNENFKDKYFSFYDDIKTHTRKKQDW